MRSSSGEHFIALDHVRALAAFLVFTWHFTHGAAGYPVPFDYVSPVFFLAPLDEGHTGVALFMTLSGYLFAKLLNGKQINYSSFLWNRVLRLVPLLAVVITIVGLQEWFGGSLQSYAFSVASGLVLPTLPNGGWSITTELHFYVLLPALLWLLRRHVLLLASIVAAAITIRVGLHAYLGEVQSPAYWTIIGRIDQFSLGILAFHYRRTIRDRHFLAAGVLISFCLFYWYFDSVGGWYLNPSYPSPSSIWIFLPTIEGLAYGFGIAYYDSSFAVSRGRLSSFIAEIGKYSYSIYLLHVFFVFEMARIVNQHIMWIADFYRALAWSVVCFLLMVPVAYLSYRYIEAPFLKLRRRYVLKSVHPTHRTHGLTTEQLS
ncbi:MAG TPA: acyltransferase [Burkholderiales bacterium]|nr:acyltransferase [Burkholderiales bacterium]